MLFHLVDYLVYMVSWASSCFAQSVKIFLQGKQDDQRKWASLTQELRAVQAEKQSLEAHASMLEKALMRLSCEGAKQVGIALNNMAARAMILKNHFQPSHAEEWEKGYESNSKCCCCWCILGA